MNTHKSRAHRTPRALLCELKERGMALLFLLAALVSILCVGLICVFLFANGIPAMRTIGLPEFLLGRTWKPGNDIYGIFPMIVGSVYVTGGALALGVPIALLTAIYLAYFCPARLYRVLRPAVDLLAGIPSVVHGFFGIVVLVPAVRAQRAMERQGQFHRHGLHSAGDHDPADDHRRGRARAARRAAQLL